MYRITSERMFFNTGITTYIWIVTNKKSKERRGKVQLIDGSSFKTAMRKNLGDKGNEFSEKQRKDLFEIYQKNQEDEFCKIYDNHFFGYTKVTIDQPLIADEEIVRDRRGKVKPDAKKRDYERIPLSEDINEFFEKGKASHPDSWMDRSKDKIGYEINFYQILL